MLLTVAYPVLRNEDATFVEAFRQRYDPRVREVAAHFTLAFGCAAVPQRLYLRHVEAVCKDSQAFDFACRYAMLSAGHDDENAYVFLVPDEGLAALSLLHDAVNRGVLTPHLRLDVPYVPHITIGVMTDRVVAKSLCDELNSKGVDISGRVQALTVIELDESGVGAIEAFALGGG